MKTSTFHSILPKSGKGVPSSEAQGAPDSTIVGPTHRQKNQILKATIPIVCTPLRHPRYLAGHSYWLI